MGRLRRFRTPFMVAGLAVTLYAAIGFFLLPWIIKAYGVPALSDHLHRPVLLRDVQINPFALSIDCLGFEVQELDRTAMLGFDELYVNFELSSLFHQAYTFDEIRLVLPFALAKVEPDGTFNLNKLGGASNTAPSQEDMHVTSGHRTNGIPAVMVRLLEIERGVVEYRDESKKPRPVSIDIVPIEFTLKNFSTQPGGDNSYAFTAEFDQDEVLAWEGTFLVDPIESAGHVSLRNLQLRTVWPAIRDLFAFDVLDGLIDISSRYRFAMTPTPLNLQLTEGSLGVTRLKLGEKGGVEPLVTVPTFDIAGVELDLSRQSLKIDSVRSRDARLRAWTTPDGTLNYQTLFATASGDREPTPAGAQPADQASDTSGPSREAKPWSVLVKTVALDGYAVEFQDQIPHDPVDVTIDDLAFTTSNLRVPFTDPLPVTLGLTLNTTGRIETSGTVQVSPLRTNLDVTLSDVALAPFQPYLDQFARLKVLDGTVAVSGQVQVASEEGLDPDIRYHGRLAVDRLAVADGAGGEEFLSWDSLAFNQVALDLAPLSLSIGEVVLDEPAVHVRVDKSGMLNISQLTVEDQATGTASQTSQSKDPAASSPTSIEIGAVKLTSAEAVFTDRSIQPTVSTGIHDLTGTIKGLSSKQIAKADVALSGRVDNIAPVKIQGKINPLRKDVYTDLTFAFNNMDLTTASPYAGRYVGYPITKGKLFLDLKYSVSEDQLVGENKLRVDQLTLGEKTESPDATSLPVRLALALLKDRRGQIDIDLPVRGDLNDPDFHYGRVVLNALVNLITKVATSPFAALGSMLPGGGGEDLQYIEFDAGQDKMGQGERNKLASLGKALAARPGLRLEVVGSADPTTDRRALTEQKLSSQLQQRLAQGKKSQAQPVALTPAVEDRLLREWYVERFGNQPTKTTRGRDGKEVEEALSSQEIKDQLLKTIQVQDSDLRLLAQARAKQVRERLVADGAVAEERVFLVEVELTPNDSDRVRSRLNLSGG